MKLTEFITDIGRPVAFYPGLRKITGSTTATLLLCQLIYWTGKQADPDGWIYKTSDDIEDETGLSYDEQSTARKQLVRFGFIEEQYKRLDHQMAFRIMANAINDNWRMAQDGIAESRNTALGKADSQQSLNSNTETTSETTTETTSENNNIAIGEIFKIYEDEIGALTGFISDEIQATVKEFPIEWIPEAIKQAARYNKRSWAYASKILSTWKTEGRGVQAKGSKQPEEKQEREVVFPNGEIIKVRV